MKVSVWDTYVKRGDQKTMHFDILVPNTITNEHAIYEYGRQYLAKKSFETGKLTANECRLCHMEEAPLEIEEKILKDGYYIIEMENCH